MAGVTAEARRARVLVYSRATVAGDLRANFTPLAGRYDLLFLTDGHVPGTETTREAFYQHLSSGATSSSLSATEKADVLRRCRLLRNLDPRQASRLVEAMSLTLAERLDVLRPDLIVCHMVDEYVTHVLSLLARKRGIRYLGYAGSFFPGLIQVTDGPYGRPFDVREADRAEARPIIEKLTQALFRQNYGQRTNYTFRRHLLGIARYGIKRLAFAGKALIERDPWNVHYAITPFLVERRRISDYPHPSDFEDDWSSAVRSAGRPVIYLPLGYFPESTIDYWTPNPRILEYEDRMVEIAGTLGAAMTVVIKEHPHMMGARQRSFYRRLRTVSGVVLVHPLEYSSEVLQQADAIVLGAGSGGVEAVLRDKPVFTFVETSYWFEPSGATYLDLDDVQAWPAVIRRQLAAYQPLDQGGKEDFVMRCLASTMRTRPGQGRWPLCDLGDLDELLRRGLEPPGSAGDVQPAQGALPTVSPS